MKRLLIPVLLLCGLAGCVRSIRPFYTDAQVTYDPALPGTWADAKRENTFIIAGDAANNVYNVSYIDKDSKVGHFQVHLATVNGQLLADIFPAESKSDDSDAYKAHLVAVHSFMLVVQKSDELHVRLMDLDWAKKYLADHPEAVPHTAVDHDVLLTGTSEQVQAFALANIATPGAYGDETVLTRLPTTQPTTQP